MSKFPAIRGPHLPLDELVDILGDVAIALEGLGHVGQIDALDARIGQCSAAIAACRRQDFSLALRRALACKVLELETDVLVLVKASGRHRAAKKRARPVQGARAGKKRQLSSRAG